VTKNERRRDRRISEGEERQVLDACKQLNELPRANAKLTWDIVHNIRARAQAGVPQRDLAGIFNIPQSLCSEIVSGQIWDPEAKLTTGDEMRDRIIGALDTGCRRGEMMKIQNKHVDWQHRWIRILKENSKTEMARVIPVERGSRLEEMLRRRAFLGPDAYVFGHAKTGDYVGGFRSAWETLLLLGHGIEPAARSRGKRRLEREALRKINLHWHATARGVVASRGRGRSGARTADAGGSREHHDDVALHERASKLAGGIDAASAPAPRRSIRAAIRRQHAGGLKMRVRRYRLLPVCHPTRVSRLTLLETFQIVREFGGEGQNRTADTTIFSRMLYQLSYLAPHADHESW
jgi:integrase